MVRAFINKIGIGKNVECGDEDEDPEKLLSEIDKAVDADEHSTFNQKLLAKLLTKVRAFIAKVRGYVTNIYMTLTYCSFMEVRRSPAAKKYFKYCVEMIMHNDKTAKDLELIAYCATRWETWECVIERMLKLRKVLLSIFANIDVSYFCLEAIDYFIISADKSDSVPVTSKDPYAAFEFMDMEWTYLERILDVLKARPNMNSYTLLLELFFAIDLWFCSTVVFI